MCDTLCALPQAFGNNVTIFAKNSDRSPNEPHVILHVPAADFLKSSELKCTYISISQVEHTYEMILYKPTWIWGAEMGVNEKRVAIGNEAVFTKAKKGKPSLIGMDLLRLALERADSAYHAVEVIIDLLLKFGQGGNCGYDHNFYYDNSFLAAGPEEAYILETSGKRYAVKKIEKTDAISNRLSIEKNHIIRSGLGEHDSFSKSFTEPVYSHFSGASNRRCLTLSSLNSDISVSSMFSALRQHNVKHEGDEFTSGSVKSVCMHAGGMIGDHTTGSLVAVLRKDAPMTLWSTGASTPCISAFKPIFFGCPPSAPLFDNEAEGTAYWLKREKLHRAVIAGLVDSNILKERINKMEVSWLTSEKDIFSDEAHVDTVKLSALTQSANEQEQAFVNEFSTENWNNLLIRGRFGKYWKHKNNELGNERKEAK